RPVQHDRRPDVPGADGADAGLDALGLQGAAGAAAARRLRRHGGAHGHGHRRRPGPVPERQGVRVPALLALHHRLLPVHAGAADGPERPRDGGAGSPAEELTRGCPMGRVTAEIGTGFRPFRWPLAALALLAWLLFTAPALASKAEHEEGEPAGAHHAEK